MSSTVEQIFTRAGGISAALPSFGGFLLYAKGLDASNTIKTQRSVANEQSWVDVVTYNSDQTAVSVAETTVHAQHRIVCVSKQSVAVRGTGIRVKLTKETTTPSLLAPA